MRTGAYWDKYQQKRVKVMYICKSNFAEAIHDMLDFKESAGYAKSTHIPSLNNFDRFCVRFYPEQKVLTKEIVMHWLQKRPREHAGGLKKRANTIRQFGKYLNYAGIEAYELPSGFIGGRSSYVPYLFSDEELSAFFTATDNIKQHGVSPFSHNTISVIFRVIYCCGLRPNEGRLLKRKHVNLDTGELLIVNAKANRDRVVMMSDDIINLCRKYDILMGKILPYREYFFPNKKGEAYAPNSIENQFRKCWRLAKKSKVERMPRVYDLRHRFATSVMMNWMSEGKDLFSLLPYLSAYMGHAHFDATAYYIHLLPANLANFSVINWEAFNQLIPEI